jgi:hypothetical protein
MAMDVSSISNIIIGGFSSDTSLITLPSSGTQTPFASLISNLGEVLWTKQYELTSLYQYATTTKFDKTETHIYISFAGTSFNTILALADILDG